MECHKDSFSPELAFAAHNVPPGLMRQISAGHSASHTTALSRLVMGTPTNRQGEIACAACHREHHGAMHDLTAISNASCQACHSVRYNSFAGDHPDFGTWPYEQQTPITFDHTSHGQQHFPAKGATFDCRSCHTTGSPDVMLTAGFEHSCAECHKQPMQLSTARGIAMLTVPTIDVEALRQAGLNISHWPEEATGFFDGPLPPLMKILLAAEPRGLQAMATLGEDFQFGDIDPDDEEHRQAAADLTMAIQRLYVELAENGRDGLRQRLSTVLGKPPTEEQLNSLLSGLSDALLEEAAGRWQLTAVDERGSQGVRAAQVRETEIGRRLDEFEPADARLSGLGMASVGQIGVLTRSPLAFAPAGAWHRDDNLLAIRYEPTGHADPVLTALFTLVTESPALQESPLVAAVFRELTSPAAAGHCATCHSIEPGTASLVTRPAITWPDPEQAAESRLSMNWRFHDGSRERRGFTKFSHGPHLLQPQLADCTHCHKIDTAASTAASFASRQLLTTASEFLPLSKQQCAECHRPQVAGDSCLLCHNYHVEELPGGGRRMLAEGARPSEVR